MLPPSSRRSLSLPSVLRIADMSPVLRILALLLLLLCIVMAVPLIVLVFEQDPDVRAFVTAELITLSVVGGLLFWTRNAHMELRPRQMFLLTILSWVVFSGFASLPMVLGSPQLSMASAVFEAVSGVTSTGSTVITDIEGLSAGIKLWRGLLQWIGGIGIIVMAIAILPFLKVGGMRLFHTESSDWSDQLAPRAGAAAKSIALIYLGFSVAAMLTYRVLGMNWLDAVVHAMTSVSTGGFANYDSSFGVYRSNPALLWASMFFMMTGALPFVLYIRMFSQKSFTFWQNQQVRGFLILVAISVVGLTLYRLSQGAAPVGTVLTETAFNVISVITTTGYASTDYTLWGPFALNVFFYLLFIGGCSGSTTGGMKIFRFQIGLIMLLNHLKHLVHANGVFVQRYNGRPLTDDIVRAVIAFSFFFFFTTALLSMGLSMLGIDLLTSLSASISSLGNVGPGLGGWIGPAGNYSTFPDTAKWMLCVGMIMGRLEILTVMVLLTPTFWRK